MKIKTPRHDEAHEAANEAHDYEETIKRNYNNNMTTVGLGYEQHSELSDDVMGV